MSLSVRIAAATGQEVAQLSPMHGGDLSEVTRADLADGSRLVAKTGPLVEAEARMLLTMGAAGAPVPRVLRAGPGLVLLEWLPETGATPEGWYALGAGLARLHASTGPAYGWQEDYAFGSVEIPNAETGNWPDFWAERRLLPSAPALPAGPRRRLETLAARLGSLLPATPPPALLHGDLWAGNALFAGADAYLIDPACYRGDGEVDLAMLHLFGSPPPAFLDGYGPLAPGWQERRPLYQLWPALVHLRLFGSGYLGLVTRLLDRCGA